MATSLPLMFPMTIYCGASFEQDFRWLPDGQVPQDFTGWSASLKIGLINGALVKELSSAEHTIGLTGDGRINLYMAAVETQALRTGTFSYALNLTSPAGKVTPFMRGRVEIIGDVGPT